MRVIVMGVLEWKKLLQTGLCFSVMTHTYLRAKESFPCLNASQGGRSYSKRASETEVPFRNDAHVSTCQRCLPLLHKIILYYRTIDKSLFAQVLFLFVVLQLSIHSTTASCPLFSAFVRHVFLFHGHLFSRAYLSTSKWPALAADVHVP